MRNKNINIIRFPTPCNNLGVRSIFNMFASIFIYMIISSKHAIRYRIFYTLEFFSFYKYLHPFTTTTANLTCAIIVTAITYSIRITTTRIDFSTLTARATARLLYCKRVGSTSNYYQKKSEKEPYYDFFYTRSEIHTLNPLDISVKVYSQKRNRSNGKAPGKTRRQEINTVSSMHVARVT